MKRIGIFILGIIICTACSDMSNLKNALKLSGNNRHELMRVIDHYKADRADSLKLKAAIFLIENMPGHYSIVPQNGSLNRYDQILDTLLKNQLTPDQFRERITPIIEQFKEAEYMQKFDIQTISSEYLIHNIDQAFNLWERQAWAQHLSFEDFCEYLLPYRIGNEILENWRDSAYLGFRSTLNKLKYDDKYKESALAAAVVLNDSLAQLMPETVGDLPGPLVMKLSRRYRIPLITCKEAGETMTMILRSYGIPTVMDFVPQFPHKRSGHTWNVVKANQGQQIEFAGGYSSPLERHMPFDKFGKIYRRCFAINRDILAMIQADEDIPLLFQNCFIKDVTAEYINTKDVTISAQKSLKRPYKYSYLCLFNNQTWIPVQYAKNRFKKATFKDMGTDVVYLPAYYVQGKLQPSAYPFLLDKKGHIHSFHPDTTTRQTLSLTRKSSIMYPMYEKYRMIGGRIEASNQVDFKDKIVLGCIDSLQSGYIQKEIDTQEQLYRYWRYIGPEKSHCYLAEMMFYKNNQLKNNSGVPITGPTVIPEHPENTKEMAFDANPLSYFACQQSDGGWVGMDFGEPVSFDRIILLHCNDDNYIRPGDLYELLYWDEKGWVSLGKQVAKTFTLTYKNAPTNALFILHNHSRGKEERIFSYENGVQKWW